MILSKLISRNKETSLNKIFISGAYTSMITISMAKKAGIDHKVDTRLYKGYWGLGQRREAGGIITSCKLGLKDINQPKVSLSSWTQMEGIPMETFLVRSGFLEIGNSQFEAKFGVWNETFDFVIGLDFLHRHKCKIDLEKWETFHKIANSFPQIADSRLKNISLQTHIQWWYECYFCLWSGSRRMGGTKQ